MAIIQELHLFSWKNFQDDLQTLGDLERFKLVIETIPDWQLMQTLQKLRGNGRNDHSIKAVWNSILAGIVFEHVSIQSLRRELCRNTQLRELCGFDPLLGVKAIPSKSAYARFIAKLTRHEPLIREMFDFLVKELSLLFPNFTVNLAGDGKAIHSFAKPSKKQDGDQRRDEDANWGSKRYHGIDKDGKNWEKIKSWFGFRLHLIVDTESGMPVAYEVTKASLNQQPVMRKLLNDLHTSHPELIDKCENMMLDAGYDSKETITLLWDQFSATRKLLP